MKIKFNSKILFSISLLLLCQTSCDTQGHGALSRDIKESKERHVFLFEYEVIPNPYMINDSLQIKIISAWVENKWAYGKLGSDIIVIKDRYQLVVEVEPNTLNNYNLTWSIGISDNRYIRTCGKNCLISDFNQLPENIEEWKVQNGFDLDSISPKVIIGSFKLYKKK